MAVGRRPSTSARSLASSPGCSQEGQDAAGHQVTSGVTAGAHQQEEVQVEVHLIDRDAVDPAVGDHAGDVVRRVGPLVLPDLVGVA